MDKFSTISEMKQLPPGNYYKLNFPFRLTDLNDPKGENQKSNHRIIGPAGISLSWPRNF
jgi:hypothetical protein